MYIIYFNVTAFCLCYADTAELILCYKCNFFSFEHDMWISY